MAGEEAPRGVLARDLRLHAIANGAGRAFGRALDITDPDEAPAVDVILATRAYCARLRGARRARQRRRKVSPRALMDANLAGAVAGKVISLHRHVERL